MEAIEVSLDWKNLGPYDRVTFLAYGARIARERDEQTGKRNQERAAQLRWVGGERLRELARKLDGFAAIVPAIVPAAAPAGLLPERRPGSRVAADHDRVQPDGCPQPLRDRSLRPARGSSCSWSPALR